MTTAPHTEPEGIAAAFVELFASGDLDALIDLYAPDALFVPAPHQQARGHDEIRSALSALRAVGATIALEPRRSHVVGDIAVLSHVATVNGVSPDGSPVVVPTMEVLRRDVDGKWRYTIDDPFFAL